MSERRRAQATADAAALAAAAELFANYRTSNGVDSGSAATSATTTANANGYTSSNSTITVRVYPANYLGEPPPPDNKHPGAMTGNPNQVPPGYAEVTVTYNQARFFSSMWGSGNIPVSARAVARGQWLPATPGILVLDPTASGSLLTTGNGSITAKNGPIIVDSNSASAITASGANSVITDPNNPIDVTGVPGVSGGGTISPTPTSGQPPTPDPLRFIPEPAKPSAGTSTIDANGIIQLTPGYFSGNSLKFGASDSVNMAPGIYYVDGAFTVNGNNSSTFTGSNVMIFIDPNGSLSLGGNGSVTLSPPSSGIYQGMTIFESRSSTQSVSVAGSGKFNISGTFYVPDATLTVTGNGDASIGSQLIANQVQNKGAGGGTGAVNVVYNNANVARTRVLNLVE
jgi:hypothetical protein